MTQELDLLIAGSGIAGLTAAVRAAETPLDRAAANESASRGIEAHAWVESSETGPSVVEPFAPIFRSDEARRAGT